jgi:hypothetical protein
MADKNPTGAKRPVPLDLRPSHIAILRRGFKMLLEGVRGDLETPERMPNPDRAHCEADAFERILLGLARGQVLVPDEIARDAVEAALRASDQASNYVELVAEHDAFQELLTKLTTPKSGRQ